MPVVVNWDTALPSDEHLTNLSSPADLFTPYLPGIYPAGLGLAAMIISPFTAEAISMLQVYLRPVMKALREVLWLCSALCLYQELN